MRKNESSRTDYPASLVRLAATQPNTNGMMRVFTPTWHQGMFSA